MSTDCLSGEHLYQDVITYTRLGEHRTGTPGDALTSQWVLNRLHDAGLKAEFQPYRFRQFFPERVSLSVAGHEVQAFPEWPPRFIGPEPIRAPLTAWTPAGGHLKGRIALLKYPAERLDIPAFRSGLRSRLQAMADAGALAAVLITPSPSGEVLIPNQDEDADILPLPLLDVGSRDEPLLTSAAETGAVATFLLDGRQSAQAESRNVIAHWGPPGDVIVVSTPMSGWFTCGGERGPGVAVALALAQWVAQRRPKTGYLFDFNSGHELNGAGARRFLASGAPKPAQVRCWFHLGANIATFDWERDTREYNRHANPEKYRVTCSDGELLSILNTAFSTLPQVKPYVGIGIGELVAFFEAGYRGFGFFGGRHYFFHNPGDRAHTTAPELLEPLALAAISALEAIEALPGG